MPYSKNGSCGITPWMVTAEKRDMEETGLVSFRYQLGGGGLVLALAVVGSSKKKSPWAPGTVRVDGGVGK
jgi:hypothetical protein